MAEIEIRAQFKQATVKAGTAELKFDILCDAQGAFDIIKKSGTAVVLGVSPVQEELPFEYEECEAVPDDNSWEPQVAPDGVDAETGEVLCESFEAYALPGGGME